MTGQRQPGKTIGARLGTALLASVTVSCGQESDGTTGWPFVGSDQAHSKYSTADEITADNVGELEIAWQWEPNEGPLEKYDTWPGPFQSTPIMVEGVLYLSTMYTKVVALDAETGAELWAFDPRAYEGGPIGAGPTGFKHRGVAYWGDGARSASSSTAATGCMRSMPRAVNWTQSSERTAVSC